MLHGVDHGHRLTRAHARLREELEDDGVELPADPHLLDHLLEELDHVRRPPLFEQRAPVYGSFLMPAGTDLAIGGDIVDLIDLDGMTPEQCRTFADGRSTYLVHRVDGPPRIVCFDRSIQHEADLVEVQQRTGAWIVQRTVMGTVRFFTGRGVTEWNGRNWALRLAARHHHFSVCEAVPEAPVAVLEGLLELAVHWLSPAHIGATLVLDVDPHRDDLGHLDVDASLAAPDLHVDRRHHYPALFAVLRQTDLATMIGPDGRVERLGVGLRSSLEAENAVPQDRGMRHRSAARYTHDHHHTVAFVVSEDGPVSVFRRGRAVVICETC